MAVTQNVQFRDFAVHSAFPLGYSVLGIHRLVQVLKHTHMSPGAAGKLSGVAPVVCAADQPLYILPTPKNPL